MKAKTFEIRDRNTFIPVLAVQLAPEGERDRYLLARAGFGLTSAGQGEYIQLCRIVNGGGKSFCDPHEWADRTFTAAHQHMIANWNDLESGAVIDVQFILGESEEPKRSEAEVSPL